MLITERSPSLFYPTKHLHQYPQGSICQAAVMLFKREHGSMCGRHVGNIQRLLDWAQ